MVESVSISLIKNISLIFWMGKANVFIGNKGDLIST